MNIAIKLPNDLNERVLCFPFLHVLNKELTKKLEEDEFLNLHLICIKDDIEVLNLLPFQAYYHELEPEDLKTIFSVHRACMNFKIDKIDTFISLTESFVDASIGKNLFAEDKIGYAIGQNKWVLNKRISKLKGRHVTEQTFQFLTEFVDELPSIPQVFSRDIPPFYADYHENPYAVLNLDLKSEKILQEWEDFFDLYVNQNFVFIYKEEQKELLEEYIKKLPKKNSYKTFKLDSYIDFGKLISYAKVFITYDGAFLNIAAYCGAKVLHLHEKMNLQVCGPQFFGADVRTFSLSDPGFKADNGFNYSKIFDEIYQILDDKSEEEVE